MSERSGPRVSLGSIGSEGMLWFSPLARGSEKLDLWC